MFEVVRRLLGLRWSPEQIAPTLAALYPKGHGDRVSTETIYNCIYDQPVGVLKRELVACLRPGPQQVRTAPQTGQCSQHAPSVYRQALEHCSADAPEHDVRPRQRDAKAQRIGQGPTGLPCTTAIHTAPGSGAPTRT